MHKRKHGNNMTEAQCNEFMGLLEGLRTAQNSMLIDAIKDGFAVTEGKIGDAAAVGILGGLGALGAAGVMSGFNGDNYADMNERGKVEKQLVDRGWNKIDLPEDAWNGKRVNLRPVLEKDSKFIPSYEKVSTKLDAHPHYSVSPNGSCKYDVLTGKVDYMTDPGNPNGKTFPVSINDAYNKSVCK